jgi:hypothetical protein
LAILANTLVYFAANPTVNLFKNGPVFLRVSLTYYDLVGVFFIALVSAIFISSAISTAAGLSREDRVAARARSLQEKITRRQARREQHALRKSAGNAARPTSRSNVEIDR